MVILADGRQSGVVARADMTRGQNHAHRAFQPDLARQSLQPPGERGEADMRFR